MLTAKLTLTVRYFAYIFSALVGALSIFAFVEYPGERYIYLLFTVTSLALLYSGFRRGAIFFDTFIAVFFWLGFWLKLSFRVAFMDGQFYESVGHFDGSGAAFDRVLLIVSCAFLGLLTVSFVRQKWFFAYDQNVGSEPQRGLLQFYTEQRKGVLTGFVVLFVVVALTNMYFGIYQRGAVPRTVLPFGLSGIISWLLLFGFATVTAMILHFEVTLKRVPYVAATVGMLESFFTNVSLLSRGMILNAGAMAFGLLRSARKCKVEIGVRFAVASSLVFVALFFGSILIVNYLRSGDIQTASRESRPLILDRWVGIEGVMAVASYPDQGWDLWNAAWKEVYSDRGTSFYDMNLITSPYRSMDVTKHHYISLPGVVAFCFYPGSFLFLFVCMLMVGAIGSAIEIAVYKLGGGNVILCALLAQVVASRFSHFGYVPSQSYLLFGAIFLNLFIIYFANRFADFRNCRRA